MFRLYKFVVLFLSTVIVFCAININDYTVNVSIKAPVSSEIKVTYHLLFSGHKIINKKEVSKRSISEITNFSCKTRGTITSIEIWSRNDIQLDSLLVKKYQQKNIPIDDLSITTEDSIIVIDKLWHHVIPRPIHLTIYSIVSFLFILFLFNRNRETRNYNINISYIAILFIPFSLVNYLLYKELPEHSLVESVIILIMILLSFFLFSMMAILLEQMLLRLKRLCIRIFYNGLLALIVFFLYVDYVVFTTQQMHLVDSLSLVSDISNLDDLLFILNNIGFSLLQCLLFIVLLTAVVSIGIFFYWITGKYKVLPVTFSSVFVVLITSIAFFYFLQYLQSTRFSNKITKKYQSIFSYQYVVFNVPSMMKKKYTIELDKKKYSKRVLNLKNPISNIYLIIIETLRQDVFNKENMGNIFELKNDFVKIDQTYAAGNETYLSWFGIFHSLYPVYIDTVSEIKKYGSNNLQLLKKNSYDINVLSGSGLRWGESDKKIFGRKHYLANYYYSNDEGFKKNENPNEKDKVVLKKSVQMTNEKRQLFTIFLESGHFPYYFPGNMVKYKPIKNYINPLSDLTNTNDDNIIKIKNRYYNAVYYLDMIVGQFLNTLKKKGLYDDALIIITGDHGEEFWENGTFGHHSNFSNGQIATPILIKAPKSSIIQPIRQFSHVDIFDFIFSLLEEKTYQAKKYSLVFGKNGSTIPGYFSIITNNRKSYFSFSNFDDIWQSNKLYLSRYTDIYDEDIPLTDNDEKKLINILHQIDFIKSM